MADEELIISAKSEVREVTVYDHRAQVHRHSVVALPKGARTVRFRDLPDSLDRDSLQVGIMRAENDNSQEPLPIVLRGVTFDRVTQDNAQFEDLTSEQSKAAAKVVEIEQSIQEVRDALQMLSVKQALTTAALNRATSSTSGTGEAVYRIDTWEAILHQHMESFEQQLAEQRTLEASLKQHQTELKVAKAAATVSIARRISYSVVDVLLVASQEVKEFVLVVSYMMTDAWWHPEYEVRVNSTTLEMKLMCNAVLRQRTAEDWSQVHVTVSTASPSQNGRQPELTPWRVDIEKRVSLDYFNARPMSMMAPSAAAPLRQRRQMVTEEEDCIVAEDAPVVESASMTESAVSVSFKIPRVMTVRRDGEEVRSSLVTLDFQTTLSYTCIPSLAEAVFASAKADNTSGIALRSGKAAIFLDGQYVASSTLPRTPAGEPLIVSVGRDEGITVTRKLLNRQRADDGGMFSGKKDTVTYTYSTTLKSSKSTAVSVKVQDRVPMSDNEDLVVGLVKPDPEKLSESETKKLENEGIVELTLQVPAGGSVESPLSFTVTSPAKSTVYGL